MDKSSAVEYINQMFPTEASLSGIEPLMQKIQGEIRRVDDEILAAVRQQSNSGTKAKEDLAAATHAVEELMHKIREIKGKAEQSETMVQEICRDIKKLDFAKKHITTTITALHRLTMLVSAVEQLQVMASKRQYREAAAQLEAVNQLCSHFEAYKDNPKISELGEKFKSIKQVLKSHIFSDFSRFQLVDVLGNPNEKLDVATLLKALQRTLDFEDELAEKFGVSPGARNVDGDANDVHSEKKGQPVSNIRKKYEKKLAIRQGKESEEIGRRQEAFIHGAGFNFHGIISSCFEPHLIVYVELEEKTLMEHLEKLVQEETWEIDEGSQTSVLSSSMQVFLIIKRSLKRCSALTKRQTLLDLIKVFRRILKTYASKLFDRLPKSAASVAATAVVTDGQMKASDRDERIACYIVNTAVYCHKTSEELAENVSKIIDPQLVPGVDMSDVQDEFSTVITQSLKALVHGLETKFEVEMAAMTRVPWASVESVGDQSEYVNGINLIFNSSIPVIGKLLSPVYFQYFIDKLASSLAPRFYVNIFKCKQISETGAQQMLLDTQAMKTILLEVPSLGKQITGATSYVKVISRELSKSEALLKVILSPVDSVADTYRALLPEGTLMEFQRILELKGLKKGDQQSILDEFSKHGPGLTHQPISPPKAATVQSPIAVISSSSAGVLASPEDVLTRAAALGRGAATTGFKRFLALTEAAKDRKDGPFRKLFNP